MVLGIIIFTSGAVIMVLELTGSRIVAPYVGTSIYVWTSLISIILGSLSIGYWLGGKLADRHPSSQYLSTILLFAALFTCLIVIIKSPVFSLLQEYISDIRLRAILATLFLFAIPSLLLGMVSPYAVKLKLHAINTSASTVGNLYALSTLGSIAGTLTAGFFLTSILGSTKIILLLSLILVVLSGVSYHKSLRVTKLLICIFAAFLFFRVDHVMSALKDNGFLEKESAYNTIHVFDTTQSQTRRPIRLLQMGLLTHSGKYLDSGELLLEYTKYYDLAYHFNPDMKKALMIGGGAYSYPQKYLQTYPENTIDVVEIDPELTQMAKKHFGLRENPRMKIFHQDGRIFLNETNNIYDVILLDAFGHDYIPFHLTTKEALQKMYDSLSPEGVVVTNIVSSLEGKGSTVLKSSYKTYASVFPKVYIVPVRADTKPQMQQNIMLVATKSHAPLIPTNTDPKIQSFLNMIYEKKLKNNTVAILTDDFAPVELYSLQLK